MPTCLVAWELGGGLGHVTVVRPLLEALAKEDCRLFAAVQDIGRAARCFRGLPVEYLQAPHRTGPSDVIERPANFTQSVLALSLQEPLRTAPDKRRPQRAGQGAACGEAAAAGPGVPRLRELSWMRLPALVVKTQR